MCELTSGAQWGLEEEREALSPTHPGLRLRLFVASSLRHEEGGMGSLGLFRWGGEQSPDLAPRSPPVQVLALPLLTSSVHSLERGGGSSLAGKGPAVLWASVDSVALSGMGGHGLQIGRAHV